LNDRVFRWLPWLTILLIVIADQFTKSFVVNHMSVLQSIPWIGDTIRWTYVHNDGMAFSMTYLGGRSLGVISLVAAILFSIFLSRMRDEPRSFQILLAMVIGGAIGNTIDRLRLGFVIDFIDVDLPDRLMERWPVFNVADSAVSVGVTLMILMLLFRAIWTHEGQNRLDQQTSEPVEPSEIPRESVSPPGKSDDTGVIS
jgi:signal peptidase II